MEILLLGTSAAEAWPAPFCRCEACAVARRQGGRDIRSRSGALIDGVVKIDFGPDTFAQMQHYGLDLWAVSTLAITHAHNDHFTPAELQYRKSGFVAGEPPVPLDIYANPEVTEALELMYPEPDQIRVRLHAPLAAGQTVTTPDGTDILPLPARHSPGALLLRISRGGRHLFYGHDTGDLLDETIEALAGVPLDMALLDCTYGATQHEWIGHMGLEAIVSSVERLRAAGAVTENTLLMATHISHNSGLLHEDLSSRLAPHGVQLAYDGMSCIV
ncbi:MAG: MBL fold metallo-hydrolase [Capsulimonadaceae bacterium]